MRLRLYVQQRTERIPGTTHYRRSKLLKNADIAMYAAKRQKNGASLYSQIAVL